MAPLRFRYKLVLLVGTLLLLTSLIHRISSNAWLTGLIVFPLFIFVTAWLNQTHQSELRAVGERLEKTLAQENAEPLRHLLEEKTFLEAILSALIESVIALDPQGRILFLNPAAENLFDVSSSKAKGRPFLEALRHSPLDDVIRQTLAEQKPQRQEITVHAPAEHTLSVHATPVNYGEGQTGVVAALHDISELRKLERVRQEFVANASHELKTPLTAIKGFVETLLDGALEDPKNNRQFLETIQEHSNNLMRLLEDLLDLSAIEAKRMEYRMEPVVVSEVAQRLVKGLSPMAKTKKVTVTIDLPETLPRVYADREKLAQILLNLLDNAIKFNKSGGQVRLTAGVKGTTLEIRVRDTGMGIAPEDLPRVFERFFRGDKSHSREIAGTGLGLAIVKHLVEAHQGTVSATSILEEGSTFSFTLPLA